MATQDLFKSYFRNPKKKFIESNVICPECDATGDYHWKIDKSSVIKTDGTNTEKLADLSDISSPINKSGTLTTEAGPNGDITIPGDSKGDQNKESYFGLAPDFGLEKGDPGIDGIDYNTDICFDFSSNGHPQKTKVCQKHDPNRKYPILDQINDYFACIGEPIKASIEYKKLSESNCLGTPDDTDKCKAIIDAKREGATNEPDLFDTEIPNLVFKSTISGYEFDISKIEITKYLVSEEFPTSPYTKSSNLLGIPVYSENDKTKLIGYISELQEVECLSAPANKYTDGSSVSYTIKIEYPQGIDPNRTFVWLRTKPYQKYLDDEYKKYKFYEQGDILDYVPWYKTKWTNDTIKNGEWIPISTLFIALGTEEHLINPILIKNPNPFPIKIQVAKHV